MPVLDQPIAAVIEGIAGGTPVPVSGSFTVEGGLTDDELRATPVPVSGPLTDTELRASVVPVKGTDNGPAWTSAHGVSSVPFTSADAQTAAAVTDAPTSGQKLVITDLFVSNNSAVAIQFTFVEETSATVITGPYALPAGTCAQLTPRGKGWKLPTANKKLMVDASAAGNIMVDAHYFSEA